MPLCLATLDLVPAARDGWRAAAQILVTRGPCTKLLLLSLALFAVALVLRRLIHHIPTTTLAAPCDFTETRAKTP